MSIKEELLEYLATKYKEAGHPLYQAGKKYNVLKNLKNVN